ncbi:hypothetical protein C8A03DRAFT_18503 [Achaetomium macrosporum]|uniref:Uncharacterized protein n=1 Tax=Achaetomium macrosporum TaxID=79813 RepID=A0AAN7C542_9PEZI|nr:hypothetical protein C8A03DRAFT_18503 [Achaetomium macrosporum]
MVLDYPQPAASPATPVTATSTTVKSGAVPETQSVNPGAAQAGNPPSQLPTIADTAVKAGRSSLVGQSHADNNEELRRKDPITTQVEKPQNQPGNFTPIAIGVGSNKTATAESPKLSPQPTQPAQQHLLSAPRPSPPPPPPQQQTPQQPHPHQHQHPPQQDHPHPVPEPQHPHPHPHPGPPHTLQFQEPAPHHQARAQIPPPSHQHQQPPPQPYQHHHHTLPQQPPPPPAPVTSRSPLHQAQVSQFHSHPQPQPVLRSQAPLHRTTLSKPVIMDPPAVRKQSQPQQVAVMGFPSPTQDYATLNPKFVDDCTRMNFAIQQSLPEAVRRIVRDHWQKCLLGSDFHQAFVLNASIHHAIPSMTQRAVRDFGSKMVDDAKHELMAHFTTEALDEVADVIISKASDSFLDKCLEKRLLTIEAKPLIKALAKAERLGYEPGDVIQDDERERVIPQEAYPGTEAAAPTNGYHARPSQPPPTYQQESQRQLQCMKCFRTFVYASAYDHHTKYNVCSQLPPTVNGFEHSCPHCGQGFTRIDGLQAHLDMKVCGNFGRPLKIPIPPPRTAPAPQPQPSSPAILPSASSRTSPTNDYSLAQPQSTPVHPSLASRAAAAAPGSSQSPIAADPYAHLSKAEMEAMNEELRQAELKYAPRFAEAEKIPDETTRRARIEGLRNSFGTKQSMIRKKYGVRLRERRTKAEIMAERERMGLKRAEKEKARAMAQAQKNGMNPSPRAEATSRPAGGGSGWTAANTPRANTAWDEHDAKRRRVGDAGDYQTPYKSQAGETPTRKTHSVSEVTSDFPASQPTKVYEQSGVRVEIHEPSAGRHQSDTRPATPASGVPNGHSGRPSGAQEQGSSEKQPVVVDDSSSSSDDEDIPSTLPTHVRKSLASGGTTTSLLQNS